VDILLVFIDFFGIMRAYFMFGLNTVYAESGEGIAIHLAPDILWYIFDIPITSTLVMTWFVMILLTLFVIRIRAKLSSIPHKAQSVAEMVVGGGFEYIADALESRTRAKKYFPLIMTIFIFILSLNWIGLLPGVDSIGIIKEVHGMEKLVPFLHPANTDLNLTISFAIIAFFAIEIIGITTLGFLTYGKKFINFSSPLAFLIGIIELFSELARLVSFSFRLFGNIFAGKTLLVIAIFFVPFILPVPILAFEMFVGLIQAFIFAVLTLFFIKLSIQKPEH
jgi:F-type H+-transporting ATPase subunit a